MASDRFRDSEILSVSVRWKDSDDDDGFGAATRTNHQGRSYGFHVNHTVPDLRFLLVQYLYLIVTLFDFSSFSLVGGVWQGDKYLKDGGDRNREQKELTEGGCRKNESRTVAR